MNKLFSYLIFSCLFIIVFSCSKSTEESFADTAETIEEEAPEEIEETPSPGTGLLSTAEIQAALDNAKPGDTIVIGEGTIKTQATLNINVSGTASDWITIKGSGDKATILDGSDFGGHIIHAKDQEYLKFENFKVQESSNFGIFIETSHHITIQNIEVDHTWSSGIYIGGSKGRQIWCQDIKILDNKITRPNSRDMDPMGEERKPAHEGITLSRVDGFEVGRNEVADGDKEGIDCKGPTRNGVIYENHVHHHDSHPFSVGIYVDAWSNSIYNIEIRNNIIHDCGDGVQIQSENDQDVYDVTVHHNLIYNMFWSGIGASNYSGNPNRFTYDILFYNNTVHNTKTGIWVNRPQVKNLFYYNNIISASRDEQISNSKNLDFEAKNILFKYNLFYGGNKRFQEDNVYDEDPLFVDTASFDFSLTANSPAIDAGDPESIYNDPDGSRNDIGYKPYQN